MSYFDEASLVMIPSGYKTSKVYSVLPTDGSGDLTFSRSNDTATRVNSDGLIEKVRTNLLTYSNTFSDAAWTKNNVTLTSGQVDPNGGTSATRAEFSGVSYMLQNPSTSFATASIYVRATSGTASIRITDSNGSFSTTYNLTEDWQRITTSGSGMVGMSIDSYISGSWTAQDVIIAFAQFETGDIATPYIATASAAVSVGPVANLPRLDYLDSSCPRLLLEPQRTNLALYSEQFDSVGWNKGGFLSVTANVGAAPDGTTTADLIYTSANWSNSAIFNAITVANSTEYTNSIYVKASGKTWVFVRGINDLAGAFFNVSTGEIGTVQAGVTATITNYGNGWYRCSVTQTSTSTLGRLVTLTVDANGSTAVTASGTDGLLIWGAQIEQGAYPTSYIPTLGASVTRGADATYKGSISSLIGATEGVLFVDFIKPPTGTPRTKIARLSALLTDSGNSFVNSINLDVETNGNIRANIVTAGTSQVDIQTAAYAAGTRIKMAFAYKANDCVLYINGTQIGTDTSATIPVCTAYEIASYETANTSQTNYVSQALLFPTRLSNADLATLTSL